MPTPSKHITFLPGLYQAAIRTSLAIGLSLPLLSCNAQSSQVLKAPVNVALQLYQGCIEGTLQSTRPDHKPEIKKFVDSLDEYCLEWTVIWYSTQAVPIKEWDKDKLQRFSIRRNSMLEAVGIVLNRVTPP